MAKTKPDIVEVNADQITPDVCRAFHDLGVEVQVQTLGKWDCLQFWERSLEAGVDYFQPTTPERFWRVRFAGGSHSGRSSFRCTVVP